MDNDAEIGRLTKLKQAQKATLEDLRTKGKKIAAAYSAFGFNEERWCVSEIIGSGGAFLSRPTSSDERNHPQYLLGSVELADHIRNITAAQQSLDKTNAQLTGLGITE